uniref:Uncharacterized protein n=1 Tax=Anguilla anguilla TaxID=7936 RepID=A0A0E9W9K0_ANGAN
MLGGISDCFVKSTVQAFTFALGLVHLLPITTIRVL